MYFSVIKTFLLISFMFFVTELYARQTQQHVPIQHEVWVQQDLQRYLPDHQINTLQANEASFITLLKEQTTGIPRGIAFLVPDVNQSVLKQAALSNLYQSLNDHGWTSLLLTSPNYEDLQQDMLNQSLANPNSSPADSEGNASADGNATSDENITNADDVQSNENSSETTDTTQPIARSFYAKTFSQPLALQENELTSLQGLVENRINASIEFASQYPGFYLMICEGKVCPMMVSLIAEQKLPRPDALVMLSAHTLGEQQNRDFAKLMSQSDYPVLDLSQTWDNRWVTANKPWRAKMARKNFKTDYRQRKLNSYYDYYGQQRRVIKEILGFLYSVGM